MPAAPLSQVVIAREAFIKALATRTAAVAQLRGLSVSIAAPVRSELRAVGDDHPAPDWMSLAKGPLFETAGEDRVLAATAWAERWGLTEASWIVKWAVFALLWWQVVRACDARECRRGCGGLDEADDETALAFVLSRALLRELECQDWPESTVVTFVGGFQRPTSIAGRPALATPDSRAAFPLPGPDPRVETRREFIDRAIAEWDNAVAEQAREGSVLFTPRKLTQHVDWFVRSRFAGQTANMILDRTGVDLSTAYKAIKAIAALLGFSEVAAKSKPELGDPPVTP